MRSVLLVAAVVAATALTAPVAQAAPQAAAPSGSSFTPVSPTRVYDSRVGGHQILARSGYGLAFPTNLVPADATAVVFNLTGTGSTEPTFLAVGSLAGPSPYNTSNLNLAAGETRANLVTSPIGGTAGRGVWLEAGPAAVDAIVDLAGYYAPSSGVKFTSIAPQRVLDTRDSTPVGPGGTVTLDLSSKVPAGATTAVFNLTGTDVTGPTFVTAFPAGQAKPDASNLNLQAGQTSPNLVTVRLSADRKVTLANAYNSVDLIVDLAGYYSPDSTQSFFPLQQIRAVDTRDANGNPRQPLGSGGTHALDFGGWLPTGATAAVFNLTATNVSNSTFLTAWPQGGDRPSASNLNLVAGQTAANLSVTALSADGKAELYNHIGQVDAIADLVGYFAPAGQPCASACAFTWGPNGSGLKADGTTDNTMHAPTAAYGLSGVVFATGGPWDADDDGYALRADGTVWDWGNNGGGGLSNGRPSGLGDGPRSQFSYPPVYYSTTPGQVLGLSNITQIVAGYALKNDGTVWAWGSNYMWGLGNGSQDDTFATPTAVQVSGLTDVIAIAGATGNGYALKRDGTVWSWGENTTGQLGDGTAPPDLSSCSENEGVSPNGPNCASATPVQVVGLTGVTKIGSRLAVKSDGTVWQWGGQDASYKPMPNAHQVPGITNAVAVGGVATDVGSGTGYALLADGTVRAWGMNGDGQLGNGTLCQGGSCGPVTDPVTVAGLTGVTSLASGVTAGYALKSDGTVWAWGGGQDGELGDGQLFTKSSVPVRIAGLSGVTALGYNGLAVANPQ
ncbi:hypothetical protein [Kutzneria sp. 744]|uniref:RCC1 domain-containing protein n=1 Tax=Kutzneria sp. (strain 744) TaxID=345341 RepID=UPI0003EECA11|nr:hypothetical protein [Kutzneria sp. 744]EWM14435.1 RCC1 repeat protein [Kutzneria sp. 744]